MKTVLLTFAGILAVIFLLLFGMGKFKNQPPATNDNQQHVATGRTLPLPPQNILNNLYNTCDFIDYIFYDLSFSMSVSEPESVRGSLGYFSQEPVPNLDCTKAFGKIFYKSQGTTIQEADLHFSPHCSYIVFLGEDRQPAYACNLSQSGFENLNKLISQVRTSPQ